MNSKLVLILTLFLSFTFSGILSAATLKSDIEYLSSAALEGRRAGTPGNEIASKFLEQRLMDLGLAPLGASYRQDFTIFTKMIKNGENAFIINGKSNTFEPVSFSLSGEIKNKDLIFAGFGISIPPNDPKLKYDDYANIDVKGKIVIVFTEDPGIGNMKSAFRDPNYLNYRSLFYKMNNAIKHGAKGLLVVRNPMGLETYPNEKAPVFNESEGGGERFSILAGYMTNARLNSLLKNTNSLKLQQKISKTQKEASQNLQTKADLSIHLKKETGRVSNIVGFLKGSDPVLSKEVIVIGGHFDHLGFGGASSMDPHHEHKIHHGADDNASGTGLVLKLAKKLTKMKHKRSYVFALFNAEEIGLLGANHFVSTWTNPRGGHEKKYGKLNAMLNFDMVGRFSKKIAVMGAGSSLEWKSLLTPIKSDIPFIVKGDAVGSSDHASFTAKKIPALFFTTGTHEDYHRASDTAEKITYTSLENIIDYSGKLLSALENSKALTFDLKYGSGSQQGRARGYGAWLGCIPNMSQADGVIGIECTGTSSDSPAQKVGVIAGDVIVQIGDIEIKSIYDLSFALKYYRAGDVIKLSWMRGATLMNASLTLGTSGSRVK